MSRSSSTRDQRKEVGRLRKAKFDGARGTPWVFAGMEKLQNPELGRRVHVRTRHGSLFLLRSPTPWLKLRRACRRTNTRHCWKAIGPWPLTLSGKPRRWNGQGTPWRFIRSAVTFSGFHSILRLGAKYRKPILRSFSVMTQQMPCNFRLIVLPLSSKIDRLYPGEVLIQIQSAN